MSMRKAFSLFLFGLLLVSCTRVPSDEVSLKPVSYSALDGWSQDSVGDALPALMRSCQVFEKMGDAQVLQGKGQNAVRLGTAKDWKPACAGLKNLMAKDHDMIRDYFEKNFTPYAVTQSSGSEGLFTGYYEPELHGSYTPSLTYATPIYKRPMDLVTVDLGQFRDTLKGQRIAGRVNQGKLVPYYTRGQIRKDAPLGGNELLWVDDPVDAFFLEIQGSGRVVMPNGQVVHVGYDGQNGPVYTAIGRVLKDMGELDPQTVTMPKIRAWLKENPDKAPSILEKNDSYVFFKILTSTEGPPGAQGISLTPERSMAVDINYYPLGIPVWLDAAHPEEARNLQRLMVAQDTGGAIQGGVRGDFFWGFGEKAERYAGKMQSKGTFYILVPKAVSLTK